jgi:single-strand DNA-binding protein
MATTRAPKDDPGNNAKPPPRRGAGSSQLGRNDVTLVGRLSAAPAVRALPSGDELVSWRLVVDRQNRGQAPTGVRLPTVDTIDCVAHRPAVRRAAARLLGGETLELRGALRRRFWRGAQGAASRCEVEVFEVKRPSAASAPAVKTRTGTRA